MECASHQYHKCASQVLPHLQSGMSPDWQLIVPHDPLNWRFPLHEALARLQLVCHPIELLALTCSVLALLKLLIFVIYLLDMHRQYECNLTHMPVVVYAMPMCCFLFQIPIIPMAYLLILPVSHSNCYGHIVQKKLTIVPSLDVTFDSLHNPVIPVFIYHLVERLYILQLHLIDNMIAWHHPSGQNQ